MAEVAAALMTTKAHIKSRYSASWTVFLIILLLSHFIRFKKSTKSKIIINEWECSVDSDSIRMEQLVETEFIRHTIKKVYDIKRHFTR